MYSGGFYPFPTLEEQWAYWSRFIMANRYTDPPKPVYEMLLQLLKDKDCRHHPPMWTTASRRRELTVTGCSTPREITACGSVPSPATIKPDNADVVRQMVEAQGFQITERG